MLDRLLDSDDLTEAAVAFALGAVFTLGLVLMAVGGMWLLGMVYRDGNQLAMAALLFILGDALVRATRGELP